jgi:hypothetical protein
MDDWCIEEERKYIFGSTCDVFMPPALAKLHDELIVEIQNEATIPKDCADKVIKIINRKFGPKFQWSTGV